MKIHPDALLLPQMTADELAALVADIRKNGLREAIKLDHTGEWLVDGRHRDLACPEASVEPRYEHLPEGTDILAYIISANLHRRHLTTEQKAEIVRQIAERNPKLSNREIAKIANVDHKTVSKHRSTGDGSPVETKTIGADGKSRPASGKISEETKAAIIASLQANPAGQKAIAEQHGVSIGTVSGIKNRLWKTGDLPRQASQKPTPPEPKPPVSFTEYAAEVARKRAPPFDRLTREERGMGSKEYGAQQHPDWPKGWTNDDVHRAEHGRVQIFTPDQKAENDLVQAFSTVLGALRTITDLPDVDELDKISSRRRDAIEVHLRRYGPAAIAKLQAMVAKVQPDQQDRAG